MSLALTLLTVSVKVFIIFAAHLFLILFGGAQVGSGSPKGAGFYTFISYAIPAVIAYCLFWL